MVMVHLRGRRECGSFERLVFICDMHEGGINQMSSLYGSIWEGERGTRSKSPAKTRGGEKVILTVAYSEWARAEFRLGEC